MSYDVYLLLIGAGIGLVASIVGAIANHFLSLRTERKKREWDRQERDSEQRRAVLLEGTRDRAVQHAERKASLFIDAPNTLATDLETMVQTANETGKKQVRLLREDLKTLMDRAAQDEERSSRAPMLNMDGYLRRQQHKEPHGESSE